MRQSIKRVMLGAASSAALAGLLATGTGVADAKPMPLASKQDRLTTDDGWKIALDASELVVNPMQNLAEAPTSREGWISSRVQATITGTGSEPVQAAILEHFLVVGCQLDVADGATVGLGASVGPTVGVTIGASPSGNIGLGASVSPSISTHIRPGKISEISLGKKQLQGTRASVRVRKARVSIDGCWGKVSVRLIGRLSVSTATADDTINVYSRRTWL